MVMASAAVGTAGMQAGQAKIVGTALVEVAWKSSDSEIGGQQKVLLSQLFSSMVKPKGAKAI